MTRSMRITASATAMLILAAGLASPVAGSTPRIDGTPESFNGTDFFPMAVGNAWTWADGVREKSMRVVDRMQVGGFTVWVTETAESSNGVVDLPGTMYFVDHEDGLFATQFLDTIMDWSHDTDQTGMLQRWTLREVRFGTHDFNNRGAGRAYTVAEDERGLAMRVHDETGATIYQRYAYGIGPVARGTFELTRATVDGVEYSL
jgi:hypothetical protein